MTPVTLTISIPTASIIASVIGTGVALAIAILPGQRELRRGLRDLSERVARIEGILQAHGLNGVAARRIYATDEAPKEGADK